MLVNKPKYNKGDVVSIRLITGEEMVGEFVEETDTTFSLARPLSLVQGPEGLGFSNSMITAPSKSDFEIAKSHILLHAKTREEFATVYLESTSGIKIATSL
jgi:hypothetical protein